MLKFAHETSLDSLISTFENPFIHQINKQHHGISDRRSDTGFGIGVLLCIHLPDLIYLLIQIGVDYRSLEM